MVLGNLLSWGHFVIEAGSRDFVYVSRAQQSIHDLNRIKQLLVEESQLLVYYDNPQNVGC